MIRCAGCSRVIVGDPLRVRGRRGSAELWCSEDCFRDRAGRQAGWRPGIDGVGLRARGRNLPGHRPGRMNRTESQYAAELDRRLAAGEILSWQFEPVKVRIGRGVWWGPDFLILERDQTLTMVDVKGTRPDEQAQRVKIRLAAQQFPQFRFVVARARPRKEGGFAVEEIAP